VDTNDKSSVAMETQPPAAPSVGILSPMTLNLSPHVGEKQRAIIKPQIITHVIDGFVIQEGPEPFPVSLVKEIVNQQSMINDQQIFIISHGETISRSC
jgi:hypothetical protein